MLVYQIAKGKKHVINFMVDEMSDKTKKCDPCDKSSYFRKIVCNRIWF